MNLSGELASSGWLVVVAVKGWASDDSVVGRSIPGQVGPGCVRSPLSKSRVGQSEVQPWLLLQLLPEFLPQSPPVVDCDPEV